MSGDSFVSSRPIWSVLVNYEAVDEEAANVIRDEIESALRVNAYFVGTFAVSDIAIVAPLVQFDHEDDDE